MKNQFVTTAQIVAALATAIIISIGCSSCGNTNSNEAAEHTDLGAVSAKSQGGYDAAKAANASQPKPNIAPR